MEDPFVNNDENILPGEFGEVAKKLTPQEVENMKLQYEADVANGGNIEQGKESFRSNIGRRV